MTANKKKEVIEMKSKNIPAIVIIGIPLCLVEHGPCGAGQVHAQSAERGRVF